jgi:hypothetical protein
MLGEMLTRDASARPDPSGQIDRGWGGGTPDKLAPADISTSPIPTAARPGNHAFAMLGCA